MPRLTNSEITEEFTNIKEYVKDLGYVAEMIPANQVFEIPTLVILIPYEDTEEEVKVEVEDKLVRYQIFCNFLPLEDGDAEFTKYLHIYSELDFPNEQTSELAIYKAINRLNGLMTVGSILYKEKTDVQSSKLQLRYTLANTRDTLVDEGAFCESLFLMITNLAVMEQVMDVMKEGEDVDSFIDKIMSGGL